MRRAVDRFLRGIGTDCGDFAPGDDWLDDVDDHAAIRLFATSTLENVVAGRIQWRAVLGTVPELDKVTKHVNGWEKRGRPVMASTGLATLHHWTAGRPSVKNPAPSLNICINGREGIPAPLIHLLVDYNGTLHVVASGRANHAGVGHQELLAERIRKGLAPAGSARSLRLGNTGGSGGSLVGVEIEHSGDKSPLMIGQIRTLGWLTRAFTLGLGMNEAQAARWHHKAWTDRKVDIDDEKLFQMLVQYRDVEKRSAVAKSSAALPSPASKVLWRLPDGRIVEVVGWGTPTPVRWLPTIDTVQAKIAEGWTQVNAPAGAVVDVVT